jgi:hypothetical protein
MSSFNVNDYGFSATALEMEYGKKNNGEHPSYPRSEWLAALARAPKAVFKYWTWVEAQLTDELNSLNEDLSEMSLGLAL